MTFDQVLVFHRIVMAGSFKAAAAELHKTQPAISLSIKKLEEELEVELFDRSAYRPVMTAHGKAFYERSQKILEGMHEMDNLSKSFRNSEEPEISIAVDGISPLPNLLKTFRKFIDRFPNTKLNFSFDLLSEAERRVLSREALMGITHFVSERESLEMVPFTMVRMLPVMTAELFFEKNVTHQAQLKDIDQIVISDSNGPRGSSFGLLDGGKKWRLEGPNFKRDIILGGLGWGHLPDHSIEREVKEGKLKVLDFPDIHPRDLEVYLIRLKRSHLGIVAKNLWDELATFNNAF